MNANTPIPVTLTVLTQGGARFDSILVASRDGGFVDAPNDALSYTDRIQLKLRTGSTVKAQVLSWVRNRGFRIRFDQEFATEFLNAALGQDVSAAPKTPPELSDMLEAYLHEDPTEEILAEPEVTKPEATLTVPEVSVDIPLDRPIRSEPKVPARLPPPPPPSTGDLGTPPRGFAKASPYAETTDQPLAASPLFGETVDQSEEVLKEFGETVDQMSATDSMDFEVTVSDDLDFPAREVTPSTPEVDEVLRAYLEEAAIGQSAAADTPRLAGKRIIVVDDDPGVLKSIERTLSRYGALVSTFSDPPTALSCVSDGGVDAVLLDWMLPEIPGQEMLKRVRTHSADLPIAVISGALWWDDAEADLKEMGASAVMQKPLDLSEVTEWLTSVA